MTEHDSIPLVGTDVVLSVSSEQALATDDHFFTVGFDQSQICFLYNLDVFVKDYFTIGIKDAGIHGAGVQVAATMKLMLFRVESNSAVPFLECSVVS